MCCVCHSLPSQQRSSRHAGSSPHPGQISARGTQAISAAVICLSENVVTDGARLSGADAGSSRLDTCEEAIDFALERLTLLGHVRGEILLDSLQYAILGGRCRDAIHCRALGRPTT